MAYSEIVKRGLKQYFNYDFFREGQEEIILDVMAGRDVLGVLPTGSGKSLCYQLPSLLMSGTTIVISPLISLMIDQVKELKARKIKRVASLNSFNHYEERQRILTNLREYKMVFISPELFQQQEIREYLKRIQINFVVIDEAHCISQWGYEFRPDYLKIKDVITELNEPPILALSATVTPTVQQDIVKSLKRDRIKQHIYPMDRDNIALTIEHVANDVEKVQMITYIVEKYHVPTLIYFSSRSVAERVANELTSTMTGKNVAYYHGGLEQQDRLHIQQQFMNDQLDVICCTSAFGMGINKQDIRIIIHYHMPSQIESFIQEIGRAGRDGKDSLSVLLYAENDKFLPQSFIEQELPTENQMFFVLEQLMRSYEHGQTVDYLDSTFNRAELNETQWNFLHSQLEKNGMIKGKQINDNHDEWERATSRMNDFRQKRWQVKINKLQELLDWMFETECLRKTLYEKFQETYKEPTGQCCSNCSFNYDAFTPEEKVYKIEREQTWQKKLENIFLIGDDI